MHLYRKFFFVALAWGAAASAQITDHRIIAEAPLPKPARGQTYIDPAFKTTIKRLTDAAADSVEGYVSYYSKLDAFNADETKILFYRHGPGWWMLYEVATGTYSHLPQIFNPQTDPQPRWHPTDPNKIRFFAANKIVELNLATGIVTTLAEFSGYEFITNHDEGNWSNAGNRLAICGRNWPWFEGPAEFFVYDLAQNKIISPKLIATGHNVDWVSISPAGKYFVTLTEGDQQATAQPPFQWVGLDVYAAATMEIKPLSFYRYTDHADLGLDTNGHEIFVTDNAEDDFPDSLRHMEKYDLETGAKTDLLGMDWSLGRYVSCRNFSIPGWAIVTTEVKPELCEKKIPFADEIIALKLDGSKTFKRLAHHRSSRYSQCDYSYNQYWDQANAAISRSGRWILFTSNWRELGKPQDVYLLDARGMLNRTADRTPPAAPKNFVVTPN